MLEISKEKNPERDRDWKSLQAKKKNKQKKPKPATPPLGALLLNKAQVCEIAQASYPTIWFWMRSGTFPRSRSVGGRSMWLRCEVENWIAALPVVALKGDAIRAQGDGHDSN